ncbi:5-formyltetrahydrofolate cyclo-ligase [bacterium]|nr:5-formyltetrahydrofolate cyclo-ligase [bacterium]MBU1993751.1 5-formyltetrahydrofolate cyclo-ligase [bacterium]
MPLTKVIFRENCLKKIKSSPQHNKIYRTFKVNLRLQKELKHVRNKKILFYFPLSFEADVTKTLKVMRKKCSVFLPFMQGESFKMVPFRLPLKQKKFGIFEAGNTIRNIKKIDIAIVPAVGVDGNLQRIGFGKGMYDRFFEKLRKKPYTIFTQSEFCYTNKFICDAHDVACDLLITPKIRISPMARVDKRK